MVTSRWNRTAVPAHGGQTRGNTVFLRGVYHSLFQIPVAGIRNTDAGNGGGGGGGTGEQRKGADGRISGYVDKAESGSHNNLPRFTALVPKWRNWQTR